jgi:hypothetical protein
MDTTSAPLVRFYLGAHHPNWLEFAPFPLFVSHRRLAGRTHFPTARTGWALDGGGFTELSMFGEWRTTPEQYVAAVRTYCEQIGNLEWAAPQDMMCEPFMIAKTGLSVIEHQARTVGNYLRLRELAPELPFIPVLQGWQLSDYLACVTRYEREGIDLTSLPLVGLGSVCFPGKVACCTRSCCPGVGAVLRLPLRSHPFTAQGIEVEAS